jgi:hypothetical protein
MKKNILSLAVAASAAGVASIASAQMYINTEHTGEALLFPFYSAQNGNDTLISIANTMDQTKAVKVRIIEGQQSEEVLDFNLYMSPYDHFSFAITATEAGGAMLRTLDTSCTVPAISGDVPFTDISLLSGVVGDTPAQEEGDAVSRTQVGYIEVIEMGQLDPESVVAGNATTPGRDYVTAITHVDGEPADCDAIVAAWSVIDDVEGAWYADADGENVGVASANASTGDTGFLADWAGGGLYGVATVINVAEGTAFGYDAVAIENLVADGSSGSQLHYAPGDTRPDFEDPAINTTATVAIDGAQTTYTNPTAAGIVYSAPEHTVSAVFMTDSLTNDYVVDPAINGLIDWIVTMPTKSSYASVAQGWLPPFTFSYTGGESEEEFEYPTDCQPFSFTAYDREEGTLEPPPIPDPDATNDAPQFSPYIRPEVTPGVTPDGVDPVVCNEVSIVHFGASSATNSSESDEDPTVDRMMTSVTGLLSDEDQEFTAGWAVMDLSGTALNNPIDNDRLLPGTVTSGEQLRGLPVTGFAVVEYTNGTMAGVQSNYQSSWEHKTSVVTSSAD